MRPVFALLPLLFLLPVAGCRDGGAAADSPLRDNVLYAVVEDTACPSGATHHSNCDLGSVFLANRDSAYFYYPDQGLLTVHPLIRRGDTLVMSEGHRRFAVRGSADAPVLRSAGGRTYTLRVLADTPRGGTPAARLATTPLELLPPGMRTFVHPPRPCADVPGASRGVVESGLRDTVQYVDLTGVYGPAVGPYRLLQVDGSGLYSLLGGEADDGIYRHVDRQGKVWAGTYSWTDDYYAAVGTDLRGSWRAAFEVRHAELSDVRYRRIIPKWGYRRIAGQEPGPGPFDSFSPDSTYLFGIDITPSYGVDLLINDIVVASFPTLYRSAIDDGLLYAQSDCALLAMQESQAGTQLTTNFTLTFSGVADETRPTVPLTFARVARWRGKTERPGQTELRPRDT
ncbi:hypothetical protein [Lewinella sp. IMCC34183]|uniref:hypothetical protein n=1 Tax=Lewinella sp. IMCC34183 TaxID=2248762 RepID=UPI000E2709E4|nr:hypothetical protein [Lewinella sp. IMCC34183]